MKGDLLVSTSFNLPLITASKLITFLENKRISIKKLLLTVKEKISLKCTTKHQL